MFKRIEIRPPQAIGNYWLWMVGENDAAFSKSICVPINRLLCPVVSGLVMKMGFENDQIPLR